VTRFDSISRRYACAFGAALLLLPALAQASPVKLRAAGRGFSEAARAVAKGDKLAVRGLKLEGQDTASHLDLQRIDVWRPDAVVEVDGKRVTPPRTAYFRGSVEGDASSVAVLSVRASGEVQGLVQKGGRSWVVGKGRNHRALRSKRADQTEVPPFECGNDDHFSIEERLGALDEPTSAAFPVQDELAASTVLDQRRAASIAIETDYEFYARFGNTAAALDYIGDLIGYADVTYSREIDVDMQIGYTRLWTTGSSGDPWASLACTDANRDGVYDRSPCGTSGLLGELRSYWNSRMSSVNRTVVHMLSGKSLGGGIAYIGVLCQNWSGARGNTADYGLSASLGGRFSWDGDQSHDPANIVWDIVVVQHELGHNFNSPHAHDYCNLGGSSLPIDNCSSGCQSGASVKLPTCSAPTPHFTSGGGSGTIMSYCHLRSGGYGNVAMTFGEGHTCGTMPAREAQRMAAHATSRAASYPKCFATPTCGNGVIDAGEQCDGTSFGGTTCSSLGFAGGTLACSSSCTRVTTNCSTSTCGNGVINAGEQCDGTNFGGATCSSLGFAGGTLGCSSSCTRVTTNCSTNTCGNGVINAGEQCDGTSFGGATCSSLGFAGGTLGCSSSCTRLTTNCLAKTCGNGVLDAGEQCDGTKFGTATCSSLGFAGGTLGCSSSCRRLTTNCLAKTCGNGIIDYGEQCDGTNFGGRTCRSLGFSGGTLFCSSICNGSTRNCFR
jgi:hypothetical protein